MQYCGGIRVQQHTYVKFGTYCAALTAMYLDPQSLVFLLWLEWTPGPQQAQSSGTCERGALPLSGKPRYFKCWYLDASCYLGVEVYWFGNPWRHAPLKTSGAANGGRGEG